MATDFGLSELRSRFDDWRSAKLKPRAGPSAESPAEIDICRVVEDPDNFISLSVILENLVIPELIAHRDGGHDGWPCRIGEKALAETIGTDRRRPISLRDIESFTKLSLDSQTSAMLDFIDNCLATGNSIEDIYVDLLAPTARRLGELWEADTTDFVDVTMGLWRIQEVLRELTLRIPPPNASGQGQRSALFSTMPGEQHSLGTLMVAECFQRAGWDAEVLMEPTQAELTAKFVNKSYDMVGLTISKDCPTASLTGLIKAIRSVSSNPGIRIMIGGRFVNTQTELVIQCGADGSASDAISAVAVADGLVPLRAHDSVPRS
ncbi:cobalamin B12-binding domain-containing protein [Allopontixanthobacter sediminis]|uniref:Cobalamin B12-binding protein n=1 Tax=Allopontixanthobacter sediminis TaxID=1689985 RepID=A0A845B3B6_9SPHN|nr:cobalamin B12-binding domain-containing protein [Allopontixanthobacter sediminis]MXP44890.1 cobalamin B12-binding protein [Allopontixanthobacter sediminis]